MDQSVVMSLGGGGGDQWLGLVGALLGAVLGAAASGYASYFLQRKEHRRADRVRSADLKTRQQSVAHSLLVKLVAIASDLIRMAEHLDEQFAAGQPGHQPWQIVDPLYQGWTRIEFDAAESAILLDLDLPDAFNLVGPLPGMHDQMRDANERYATLREKLFDKLPATAFTKTGLLLTDQQMLHTGRLQAEMNVILEWAREEMPAIKQQAVQALTKAHEGLTSKLDLNFHIIPKEPAQED